MPDKDRPKADDGGGSGRADEEDTEGPAEKEGLCKGCGRKGRRLSFFRLRKSKKLLHQKRKKKGICVNSRGWGRRANGGGGWCCLCLRQPKTLDSSVTLWLTNRKTLGTMQEWRNSSSLIVINQFLKDILDNFKK